MAFLTIEPDIERASTPPPWLYEDPGVWAHQCETLWARAWHLFPGGVAPREPGKVVPWTLLPGLLDEPLVWTVDRDGGQHCLSNVCTHRSHLVVGAGEATANPRRGLRCRYHGRRFELDGTCRSSPGFDERGDFPAACDHLRRLGVWHWGPLSFVQLPHEGARALAEPLAPFAERVAYLPWDQATLVDTRTYDIRAHWALYCDNYLEGLHIPFVHLELARSVELEAYEYELYDYGALQLAEAKPHEPAFSPPAGHEDEGRRIAAYYLWIFPGIMLNFYPWGISVNVLEPKGPRRTEVRYLTFVWDESARGCGAGGDVARVEREDQEVIVATARGLRSRLSRPNRYQPVHEVATHHFHRLLAPYSPIPL
ncbi:MAG: SRPBCC family protein [Myxococcota bacterium]